MKAKRFPGVLIVYMYCFLSTELSAQSFDGVLKKLYTEYREEKLYLHYDKDVYYPEETIWFKAYLFAGDYPSPISKVMYADLLDSTGKILQHKILPVIQSGASGSFTLPTDIDGRVFVRCYTKWMLNFDSTLLYQKDFYITKLPQRTSRLQLSTPSSQYQLNFFPEGGQLIEDVESRVAFKATDQSGNPISLTGTIVNNTDQSTIPFRTSHDGMGIFSLKPAKNIIYRASWKQGAKTMEAMLPLIQKTGLVLEINNVENAILYTIKTPETTPISPFVYVVAQINQRLIYRAKVPIESDNVTSGRIPTVGLPSGVVQVALFTADEKLIAERLAFANLKQVVFPVNINTALLDPGPRKKNTIEIEVPDSFVSNLSISITTSSRLPDPGHENIYTRLLLDPDIKGYIHNPGFYFSQADSASYFLDLVMMTNPWRRFKWQEVLAGQFRDIKNKPESSIRVDGEIKGPKQQELHNRDLTGILQLSSGKNHFLSTPVQQDGKFSFANLLFYDSAKLYYQLNADKKGALTERLRFITSKQILEKGVQVPLQKPQYLQLTSIIADNSRDYQLYEKSQAWNDNLKAKVLKGVTVKAQIKSKEELLDQEYSSGAFEGLGNSRIINPEDDPAFLSSLSLFDYLQGRNAGLQIDPNADEDPITWRGSPTALFVNEISQRVLSPDGKPVEDATLIRSLGMSDIAMVKIFDPPFAGAWGNGPGGAISVYIKKGGRRASVIPKEFVTMLGFSAPREFYSPDYAIDSNNLTPDYRTTLYWNPHMITSKDNQKIFCSFYTNDFPGPIMIVIEGCNEEGKLIRIEKKVWSQESGVGSRI